MDALLRLLSILALFALAVGGSEFPDHSISHEQPTDDCDQASNTTRWPSTSHNSSAWPHHHNTSAWPHHHNSSGWPHRTNATGWHHHNSTSWPHHFNTSMWPHGPLYTRNGHILNSLGQKIVYAGANWPGTEVTMLPEGLQYQSVAKIVSMVKALGMNVVRLTYAIEMIDDIYEGKDSTLEYTLKNALGDRNGTIVLNQILSNNPTFRADMSRIEVYDAVAAECHKQQVLVHLDNHVSKAEWCCYPTDGNAWFGDTYFNVTRWHRGLAYMARNGRKWPALASMALRNELRNTNNTVIQDTYNWTTWYPNMVAGADAIYRANPRPLIFFSGIAFDTTLTQITAGDDLGNGLRFDINAFNYSNKVVFELHDYETGLSSYNCTSFIEGRYGSGYNAMDTSRNSTAKNIAPVVLTEFGFSQDNSTFATPYPQCIKQLLLHYKGGWMQWAFGGSYYIRQGKQDYDETYGLLNHDWTALRSPIAVLNITLPLISNAVGERTLNQTLRALQLA